MLDQDAGRSDRDMFQAAVAALQSGQVALADAGLRRLLLRAPGHPDALHLLGVCAYQAGDFVAATDWLGQAVAVEPLIPEFRFNYGNALRRAGRPEAALSEYREAVRMRPEFFAARRGIAEALRDQRDFSEAAQAFEDLAGRNSDDADEWADAGEMWLAAGGFDRAIVALERAAAQRPENCKLWNNLGVARSQRGLLTSGLAAFQRAVELQPGFIGALGNYANALKDGGLNAAALACFQALRQRVPEDPLTCSNACFSMLYSDRLTPEEVLLEHRRFDRDVARIDAEGRRRDLGALGQRVATDVAAETSSPLRIAYLSPDFCDHPVAYFIDGILQNHRLEVVDVHLYSCHGRSDEWTRRLRSHRVHWVDVSQRSDQELKLQVEADGIDVLIDLAGHTAHNRMTALAKRLAPVQIHYLGYPFSTGIGAMDFRITDGVVDPVGSEGLASENLVRLSRSYYAYTPAETVPDILPLPMLERGAPSFGVCSNLAKVSPLTLDRWAEVLRALPDSRLIWRAKAFEDQQTVQRMCAEMLARGVEAGRLTLEPWTSAQGRWDLFRRVDLALDTFPYNQATNTCEALWMGVPTLTVLGGSHQARMGASVMMAAGLPGFVAKDAADWVGTVRAVVDDPAALAKLRANLRVRLRSSDLLDSVGLTRELEAIYCATARGYAETAGRAPA